MVYINWNHRWSMDSSQHSWCPKKKRPLSSSYAVIWWPSQPYCLVVHVVVFTLSKLLAFECVIFFKCLCNWITNFWFDQKMWKRACSAICVIAIYFVLNGKKTQDVGWENFRHRYSLSLILSNSQNSFESKKKKIHLKLETKSFCRENHSHFD